MVSPGRQLNSRVNRIISNQTTLSGRVQMGRLPALTAGPEVVGE
jgi:hypothetical protein